MSECAHASVVRRGCEPDNTNGTVVTVPDATTKQRVAATQHRYVARTPASPNTSVAAKFEARVPPEVELKRRAALSWMD